MPQPSWPEEIQQANNDLDPCGMRLLNDDVIIAFVERWRDCTPETLQRSLDAPVERTSVWSGYFRIFAIFALGRLAPSGVEEMLASFLLSPQRKERWAAAIALGRLQHEQALLLLPHLLLEGLVDDLRAFDGEAGLAIHRAQQEADKRGNWNDWERQVDPSLVRAYDKQEQQIQQYEWFLQQRCRIAQILGARGNAEVVSFLRQAFQICWQTEQQPAPFRDGTWDVRRNEWWHSYEDYLAYALGQLGAWEALTDLELPEDHLSMAIFHQALGALGFTNQNIFSLRDGSLLAPFDVNPASIARILEEHFGFSKEEQRRYIAQFRLVYQARRSEEQLLTKKDDHVQVQREKERLEWREAGQCLARKYFRQELFPVGSDFEAALALFNQNCHEIYVEPVRQQDYETNLRTDARGALGGFMVMINRLAGWQGPTYANIDGKTSVLRAPTPAWEAAHPYWREDMTAWHCGRRIQVSRKHDGYYARVLCPELDYTHGPVSSAQQALQLAQTTIEGKLPDYDKHRWLNSQEKG